MDRGSADMHGNYEPVPMYLVRVHLLLPDLTAGFSKTEYSPLPATNN